MLIAQAKDAPVNTLSAWLGHQVIPRPCGMSDDPGRPYRKIIKLGTQTIIDYYRNYNKVGKYLGLNCEAYRG